MSKRIFTDWKDVVLGAAGLIGIGYAIAMHTKLAQVSERLDKSINDLADDMEFDIPEELVNKAVEKAVNDEAKRVVQKATAEALAELKRDIRDNVSVAVDKEYETIKETVLEKVTQEAAKIDVNRVRRDVEKAAERAALEKFDDNLEGILGKFSENLNNTAKIVNSFASFMPKTSSDQEVVFRVGR